jgi:hypothetical protein
MFMGKRVEERRGGRDLGWLDPFSFRLGVG